MERLGAPALLPPGPGRVHKNSFPVEPFSGHQGQVVPGTLALPRDATQAASGRHLDIGPGTLLQLLCEHMALKEWAKVEPPAEIREG